MKFGYLIFAILLLFSLTYIESKRSHHKLRHKHHSHHHSQDDHDQNSDQENVNADDIPQEAIKLNPKLKTISGKVTNELNSVGPTPAKIKMIPKQLQSNRRIALEADYGDEEMKKFNVTKTAGEKAVILNSLGQQINVEPDHNITLTEWPFRISRCDQIVKFKAHYINDMGEYRGRKVGWFTLTAYYANLFEDETPDKLIRSVLLSESPMLPHHVRGTGFCILIAGGVGAHDLTICLDNAEEQDNVLEVLKSFLSCRGGLMDTTDKMKLTRMIANCGNHGGKFVDPRLLVSKLKKLQMRANEKKSLDFWHPGSDKEPGIPGTGNRDIHKDQSVLQAEQAKKQRK